VNRVVAAFYLVNRSVGSPFLFLFQVDRILIEHESVKEAKKGDSIGIKKISGKARRMDKVYKLG
jgi:hypothetical protein